MAGIETSLTLFDNVSNAMNKISGNADKLSNSFSKIDNAGVNSLGTHINNAAKQQDNFNNTVNKSSNSMANLVSKVGKLINFNSIAAATSISDQYVLTKARLDLINDSLQTTDQLQAMIYNSAQLSRSSYADTAQVVSKLGLLAKGTFSGNQETIKFAELMNKSFKLGGSSIQEQTAGMNQLTQAMAAGKLQGDEFSSIMENSPMLAQAISTYTGKTMGDLMQMSAEGTITSDIIKSAMFSAADNINAKFNTLPRTWGDVMTSIKNKSTMALNSVLTKMNQIPNSTGIDTLANNIVNGLVIAANAAMWLLQAIINVSSFFQNNWSFIVPVIMGIVGAILTMKAVTLAFSIIQGISNVLTLAGAVAKAVHTGATLADTSATAAQIAAQWGLNAAMLACPITWIILGIILIITAIYIAVAVFNSFAGTSVSATGIIAGVFAALGVFIWDIIAFMYNGWASFIEFFGNVFTNPVYSVMRLFANLAMTVLDMTISMTSGFDILATNMANGLIDGINGALGAWNEFVDFLNKFGGLGDKLGGKATMLNHTSSITSDLQVVKASINNLLGDTPSDYVTIPKLGMKSVGGAFDWGYGKGAGLDSSISNLFNGADPLGSLTDGLNNLGTSGSNPAHVADDAANKKLSGISDKIDISNERLEMLRDIAEQDSIKNFVTLTPTVQVTTGDIKEEADIGKLISKIELYMENELENSVEGVYA